MSGINFLTSCQVSGDLKRSTISSPFLLLEVQSYVYKLSQIFLTGDRIAEDKKKLYPTLKYSRILKEII